MKFLRRTSTTEADETPDQDLESEEAPPKGYTPSKGHATPTRREAEGRSRGPVTPPPRSTREALKRNKELRKANPTTKEDRKAAARQRRERMNAGDDRYLMQRDRGPVREYVRDLVDSRRHVAGLFMPMAVLVLVAMLAPFPMVQRYATLICTALLLAMLAEGFMTGRRVAREVREKFPKEEIKGLSIGWYAFVRASQLRKLRVPKPRVKPGEAVKA